MNGFARIPADLSKVPTFADLGMEPIVTMTDGKPYKLEPPKDDLTVECCDCGLVHKMRFNVRDGWLVIRAVRAGRLRKRKGR